MRGNAWFQVKMAAKKPGGHPPVRTLREIAEGLGISVKTLAATMSAADDAPAPALVRGRQRTGEWLSSNLYVARDVVRWWRGRV